MTRLDVNELHLISMSHVKYESMSHVKYKRVMSNMNQSYHLCDCVAVTYFDNKRKCILAKTHSRVT